MGQPETKEIYESLGDDFDGLNVTPEEIAKVRTFLEDNKGRIFSQKDLAEKLDFPIKNARFTIGKICKLLLVRNHLPIISNRQGMIWVENPTVLERWIQDDLLIRMAGLQRTIDAAQAIRAQMLNGQIPTYSHTLGTGFCKCGEPIMPGKSACRFCEAAAKVPAR